MKIGILYICTGNYTIFWKDFYLSMEKNFITNTEKHYFVFTDSPQVDFETENPKIHRIYQDNLGWPENTLMRFHIFLKIEKELENMDYLFFFNANLLILEKISKEEFLPVGKEKLLATLHPGFYNKKRKKFTYESNKKSTACIGKDQGKYYFAGGLNGGTTIAFLEAIKTINNNINIDKKNNIIAEWHDESHWNRYLIGRTDVKVLPPSYLYPEGWSLPFRPTILIRDKNKYGGHSLLRSDRGNKLKRYYQKIKNILRKLYIKCSNINRIFFTNKKPIFSNLDKSKLENANLIIITIAFNNIEIIKLQHSYLKQNLKEKFDYIIVDNSNLENISFQIFEYCMENNISYIKLPLNPFSGNPSKSHGIALNWAYEHIIKIFKPVFFGFIDHDILPFKETSITPFIKDGIFGLIQERNEKWYLWPGFCFYEYNFISKIKLNFMPTIGLDTGGSNYYSLYKNINKNNIYKIKQIYFDLEKKETVDKFNNIGEIVEIIGNWVHIMRTSNWNNQNYNKNYNLNKILDIIKNISPIKNG